MDNDSRGALASALALFQGTLLPLKPEHSADIPTKKGGRIQYKYAELADVLKHIRRGMSENGLAVTQCCLYKDDRLLVQTKILHISGEEEIGFFPVDAEGDMRALGSAVTYAKRYSLVAMLGVAISGEDDDCQMATEHRGRKTSGDNRWAQDEKQVSGFLHSINNECKTADDLRDWWMDNSERVSELNPDQVATIKEAVAKANRELSHTAPLPAGHNQKKEEPKPEPEPKPKKAETKPEPPPEDDDDFGDAFD